MEARADFSGSGGDIVQLFPCEALCSFAILFFFLPPVSWRLSMSIRSLRYEAVESTLPLSF